jgi:predicted nuclease of predicted toxin-antitoxin system
VPLLNHATKPLEAALRDLSLRDAQDIEIFEAARAENAVIMTVPVAQH